MIHRYEQQILKTAMIRPNCPAGSTNFTDNINYCLLFSTIFIPMLWKPHIPIFASDWPSVTVSSWHWLQSNANIHKCLSCQRVTITAGQNPISKRSDQQPHSARHSTIFRKLPRDSAHSYLPRGSCQRGGQPQSRERKEAGKSEQKEPRNRLPCLWPLKLSRVGIRNWILLCPRAPERV